MQVKSADAVAKKWAARAGAAGADYANGIQNPRVDWQQATEASAANYAAGVTIAAQNGSFKKGVSAAGTQKWQRKASGTGAARYPQGVQAATPDYQNGIGPVLQALQGVQLPPRGPKGDPGNINRVAAVNSALRKMKLGA